MLDCPQEDVHHPSALADRMDRPAAIVGVHEMASPHIKILFSSGLGDAGVVATNRAVAIF